MALKIGPCPKCCNTTFIATAHVTQTWLVDEDGDFIDEWPGGFFEESFHEKFTGR